MRPFVQLLYKWRLKTTPDRNPADDTASEMRDTDDGGSTSEAELAAFTRQTLYPPSLVSSRGSTAPSLLHVDLEPAFEVVFDTEPSVAALCPIGDWRIGDRTARCGQGDHLNEEAGPPSYASVGRSGLALPGYEHAALPVWSRYTTTTRIPMVDRYPLPLPLPQPPARAPSHVAPPPYSRQPSRTIALSELADVVEEDDGVTSPPDSPRIPCGRSDDEVDCGFGFRPFRDIHCGLWTCVDDECACPLRWTAAIGAV